MFILIFFFQDELCFEDFDVNISLSLFNIVRVGRKLFEILDINILFFNVCFFEFIYYFGNKFTKYKGRKIFGVIVIQLYLFIFVLSMIIYVMCFNIYYFYYKLKSFNIEDCCLIFLSKLMELEQRKVLIFVFLVFIIRVSVKLSLIVEKFVMFCNFICFFY